MSALTVHRLDPEALASRTVALLEDRIASGVAPQDIAVLTRVNSTLLPLQVALSEHGVPRNAPLDPTVLGRTGIRAALAYLRLGLDPERLRPDDLREVVNRPARQLRSHVESLLGRGGRRLTLSQLRSHAEALDGRANARMHEFCADLQLLTDAITEGADTAECLALIRDKVGLGEAMEVLDSSGTRPEGSSHGDDLDALAQLAHLHTDPVTFREWLVEQLRIEGDPPETSVTLSTVHRVKGMEWDHVVVFAANSGLYPHRLADDVEEERRVFHVAVTRCRRSVDVIASRGSVSPFVDELTRAGAGDTVPGDDIALPDDVAPQVRDDGRVVAQPGLMITVPGGIHAQVLSLAPAAVLARTDDGVILHVPWAEEVQVAGRRARLARPARRDRAGPAGVMAGEKRGGGQLFAGDRRVDPSVVDALFESLRAWRKRTADDQGVPAYIVFPDSTLRAVAERQPTDLRSLAGVPGVGPTKLDRYGDDVLAVVDQHL